MRHAIHWFEIPTSNLDRAVKFYEQALSLTLKHEVFSEIAMAIFPATESGNLANDGVPGALVLDPRRQPSAHGSLVYLNALPDLDAVLARVPMAGGRVIMSKTDIGPPGFIAIIEDTEGNVVGLHIPRP